MNISLIGFSGVGKTMIGKALAQRLGYGFIDTDTLIEKQFNKPLQTVIDAIGEDAFLEEEKGIVSSLELPANCVVATGGSAVYCESAMGFLKTNSTVVYLQAALEDIRVWIPDRSKRGIIGLNNKALEEIYAERIPLYERYADKTIRLIRDYQIDCVLENIIRDLNLA